jgi:NAD(P)-dependent dehydrogenase (short-subunit alcohol dehydrogenase family)
MNQWQGKTVWITGASSGIGRSLSIKLANLGATVVISARRAEALQELAQHAPHKLLPLPVDVSDASVRDNVQRQLAERVEALDVVIFAAGIAEYENTLDLLDERYQRVFAANFFGLVNSVAIALPLLKKSQNKPYIVGLTSLAIMVGFPRAEAYGASKAAADYFLKALRTDLSPAEFDISIVRPGFVKTPMTAINDFPMPFVMNVDEASDRIIRGINKRHLFINFPRRFSSLLQLLACLPWLWYRWLGPKMSRQNKKGKLS